MPLQCPYCDRPIDPVDINVAADVAKCASCGAAFAPSKHLAESPPPAHVSSAVDEPPRPQAAPSYTKVRVYDDGRGLSIRIPPQGFQLMHIFLIAFAIGWWSFLGVFVTAITGISCIIDDMPFDGPSDGPPIFFLCFLTPFFAAGIGMVAAILWPLFGITELRLGHYGCSYRWSMLGLGRTVQAQQNECSVRWSTPGFIVMKRKQNMNVSTDLPHIKLQIGPKEVHVSQHLSQQEQEWIYHEIKDALQQP